MSLDPRMKFAWARGARFIWPGYEKPFSGSPVNFDDVIYPPDEHLQYGPLSTALREYAIFGSPRRHDSMLDAAFVTYDNADLGNDFLIMPPEAWKMVELFFAEYLADMGL